MRVNAPDVAARLDPTGVLARRRARARRAATTLRACRVQSAVYSGQLWLMAYGSYSVYVTVDGARGSGTAIVPVNSFATGRLPLSRGLGAILVVLGVLLVAGIPDDHSRRRGRESRSARRGRSTRRSRRRANLVTGIAAPILALALFGGAKWWSAEDSAYRGHMFGSPAVDATFSVDAIASNADARACATRRSFTRSSRRSRPITGR